METAAPVLGYTASFIVRPRLARALAPAGACAAGFVGFLVYAHFCWTTHPVARATPGRAAFEALCVSAMLVGSVVLDYAVRCRGHWVVDDEGVALYRRGRLDRRVPWGEITAVDVLPFRLTVRRRNFSGDDQHYLYRASPKDGSGME